MSTNARCTREAEPSTQSGQSQPGYARSSTIGFKERIYRPRTRLGKRRPSTGMREPSHLLQYSPRTGCVGLRAGVVGGCGLRGRTDHSVTSRLLGIAPSLSPPIRALKRDKPDVEPHSRNRQRLGQTRSGARLTQISQGNGRRQLPSVMIEVN